MRLEKASVALKAPDVVKDVSCSSSSSLLDGVPSSLGPRRYGSFNFMRNRPGKPVQGK